LIIHVVKSGDNLWAIANRYGTSVQRIAADNGLNLQRSLVIGQALLILIPQTVHTVAGGDTLVNIAERYGTTVMNLLQNNPDLIQNRTLYPGRVITISFTEPKQRQIRINGYAYPYINMQVLQQTLPYLSSLTIFGYGFTENGELIPINDEPLIRACREYDVAPIMLLSSITEDGGFSAERASYIFNNRAAQNSLIDKIIATMRQKGYVGLDIDFEYIDPSDGDAYVGFVENVTNRLNNAGFTVNVDLAPKTSTAQRGLLYEGHDYRALGEAANTVLLMTYEWGYTYGPPMAVAPINQVRNVVQYAVRQLEPEKIFMGIPNYAYDWTLPYEKGRSRAEVIGNTEAISIAGANGATIMFDETAQTPYFEYFDRSRRKHIVWFEDVRSIMAKFDTITDFDLLGAGYWNVMRPFAQNWSLASAMFYIEKASDFVR